MQNLGKTQPDLLSCAEGRRIKTGTGRGEAGTLIRGREGLKVSLALPEAQRSWVIQ